MEKLGKNSPDTVEYQFSLYYKNTYVDIQRNAMYFDGGATFTHLGLT